MGHLIDLGQIVQAESSGLPCEVEESLGGGGQGEVYRVKLAGEPMALKWYVPNAATPEQRSDLGALVKKGAPNTFAAPRIVRGERTPSITTDRFSLVREK